MAGKIYGISPRQNFLKVLVQTILKKGLPLDKITILFPNRRAGLFFRYYLKENVTGPVPVPKIYAIEDFIDELFSKIDPRPKISLYDEIYLIYNFIKDEPKFKDFATIDRFLPWGHNIVDALDELDLELTDVESLKTKHLQSLSDLVMEIGDNLYEIYRYLERIKFAPEYFFSTKGERYRRIAEKIEYLKIDTDYFIVAGFFVLTNSEKKIFKNLFDRNSFFFIQADRSDLAEILENYGFGKDGDAEIVSLEVEDKKGPEISIYSASDFHQMVWDIKEKDLLLNLNKAPDKNLILLPEPGRLLPVLEFLDANGNFNITMGFPFSKTGIGTFLGLWFGIFKGAKESVLKRDSFISWLIHGFFGQLIDRENPHTDLSKIIAESISLIKSNCPDYVNPNVLIKVIEEKALPEEKKVKIDFIAWIIKEFVTPILTDIHGSYSPEALLEIIIKMCKLVLGKISDERYFKKGEQDLSKKKDMDTDAYEHFYKEVYLPIKKGIFASSLFHSKITLLNFFQNLLLNLRVPLYGRPLQGNQVMGLLESRLLSFEKVIVLEANEGILPATSRSNPLLPEQTKALLGIRRKETQEEIQRHHFRNLLQSSKEAHIYYLSRTEGKGTQRKTKSRFLEEILWESSSGEVKVNADSELPLEIDPKPNRTRDTILKDRPLRDAIERRLVAQPISATMLNTYLHCPYRFFYKYVMQLELPEETQSSDEIELGKILHKSLELFFKSQEKNDRLLLNHETKELLINIFLKELKASPLHSRLGLVRSSLLKGVAEYRISEFWNWLNTKANSNRLKILGSEKSIQLQSLSFSSIPFHITFEGRCDLICVFDDNIWVYDFKTGMAKKRTDLFSLKDLVEWDPMDFTEPEMMRIKFEEIIGYLKDIQLLFYLSLLYQSDSGWPLNGSYIYLSTNIEEMETSVFSEKDEEDIRRFLIAEKMPKIIEFLLYHMLNYEFIEPIKEDDMCKACRICV